MGRELSGSELQGFIKERQLRQVRNLRQEHALTPKLIIVMSENSSDVIQTYVRMKQRYAEDIEIEVEARAVPQAQMPDEIRSANEDASVHGIIIQLPLDDPSETDALCNIILPAKDVDGLGSGALYPSATAHAIDWLLAGYNIDLQQKHIAIVGNGKLVGGPLGRMWKQRELNVTILDEHSEDIDGVLRASDIIVTATGVPRLINSGQIKQKAVVVDAGTASENGVIVGDISPDVRERTDLVITPVRGGVGPLTYTVLFDHLIEACLKQVGKL